MNDAWQKSCSLRILMERVVIRLDGLFLCVCVCVCVWVCVGEVMLATRASSWARTQTHAAVAICATAEAIPAP